VSRRSELIASAVVVVILACAPWIAQLVHLDISLVSEVLLFTMAAMSVNLLLGFTGLPAFGNAAYFGLGAYGTALSITYAHVHFIVAVLIGTVTAFVGALVLGPFLLRRRGIYFGLLSIAFGQVFYFIAYRYTDVTGGEDGMNVARPYLGFPGVHVSLHETGFYYTVLVVFVAIVVAFQVIVNSPFGRTLVAIRQNEPRVRYLGLDSDRFIFFALMISATIAGISGSLFALNINFAYPLMLDWHESGNFVLMMILGGAGTLWGPLVGAIIYVIGQDMLSTITETWQIILGALFIACVLGFPRGILGTVVGLLRRRPGDVEAEASAAFDSHAVVEGRQGV
jgi:branched-chain amino acid transport system permease protein